MNEVEDDTGRRPATVAYLVRLWQAGPAGPWRATARSVRPGDEHHFASLDALLDFLRRQTAPPSQDH